MAIRFIPLGDGVSLNSVSHPKGKGIKSGRPTRERATASAPEIETVEVDIDALIVSKPKRKRAPNGTFDRTAYQRELMRKRRAAEKELKSK